MLGLHITYKNNEYVSFNPEISSSQYPIDVSTMKLAIANSGIQLAQVLNAYIDTLDISNVAEIRLQLNSNEILYKNVTNDIPTEPTPE